MTTTIRDIHPHIISTDEVKYPRDPLGGTQSTWSQTRPTSWQQLIEHMDAAGVAKSAIVQASTCYGFDNSYVAEAVAARPDRFSGVFSVNMLTPDAPEKINHWVKQGLTGLRLFTTGSTMPGQSDVLGDPRSFAGWEAARDLGIPVCVQMKPEGLGMLNTLIEKFPTTRIIIDHFMGVPPEGGPPYADAEPLMSVAKHPNIFLKLTIITIRRSYKGQATPESFIGKVVNAFGSNRIAWGSNFPTSEGSLKEILHESQTALAFLPSGDQDNILSNTAKLLYPAL